MYRTDRKYYESSMLIHLTPLLANVHPTGQLTESHSILSHIIFSQFIHNRIIYSEFFQIYLFKIFCSDNFPSPTRFIIQPLTSLSSACHLSSFSDAS